MSIVHGSLTEEGTLAIEADARGKIDRRFAASEPDLDTDRFVAVVHGDIFWRECIRRCMQSALSCPVIACTLSELEGLVPSPSAQSVILLVMEARTKPEAIDWRLLGELTLRARVIILAHTDDVNLARIAFGCGAKGYIPCTVEFGIAVEAVRFILAGGSYVPIHYLLTGRPGALESLHSLRSRLGLTPRERDVIRAIQEGKPNKTIAYELNVSESTVKMRVHTIMKKLKARNRTEIALKVGVDSAQSRFSGIQACN
jgi:DNA-binding NarL/FixJ family response regulator